MDRLHAMRLLVEVNDSGNFTKAGQKLNVPLSTLSRKISELEEFVGTRLLIRSTRSIAFTDAGRSYVEACRDILEQLETAESAAAGEFKIPKGTLALTAPIMFGQRLLVPVIHEFLQAYSQISVNLSLSDRNAHLVDEGFDLAVRIGQLPDSSLSAIRLGQSRRVICASPDLLRSAGLPEKPEDLAVLPCVAHDFQVSTITWNFIEPGSNAERKVIVNPRLSVSTAEAAVEAAIRGAGFARLFCYQVADAVTNGSLLIVLEQFERSAIPVTFLHSKGRAVPAKVRSFLDFAVPELRSKLSIMAA